MPLPKRRRPIDIKNNTKIDSFFKPIKASIPKREVKNDENAQLDDNKSNNKRSIPLGKAESIKRKFGEVSSSSLNTMFRIPLSDRNPKEHLQKSCPTEKTAVPKFAVLRDKDIKKGIQKAVTPPRISCQSSPANSQTLSQESATLDGPQWGEVTSLPVFEEADFVAYQSQEKSRQKLVFEVHHSQEDSQNEDNSPAPTFPDENDNPHSLEFRVYNDENESSQKSTFPVYIDKDENSQKSSFPIYTDKDESTQDASFSVFNDKDNDSQKSTFHIYNDHDSSRQSSFHIYNDKDNNSQQSGFRVYNDNDDSSQKSGFSIYRDENGNSEKPAFLVYQDENSHQDSRHTKDENASPAHSPLPAYSERPRKRGLHDPQSDESLFTKTNDTAVQFRTAGVPTLQYTSNFSDQEDDTRSTESNFFDSDGSYAKQYEEQGGYTIPDDLDGEFSIVSNNIKEDDITLSASDAESLSQIVIPFPNSRGNDILEKLDLKKSDGENAIENEEVDSLSLF